MRLRWQLFTVHKRFALTISRGTTAQTTNLWVILEEDGVEGWGEASTFSIIQEGKKNTDELVEELNNIAPELERFSALERQKIEEFLLTNQVSSSLRAAIDMALWDWLGKRANLPLWQLWGLDRDRVVPISVTVGINSPQGARQRVRDWIELMGAKVLKIKLGSREGIEADKAMFSAIQAEAPTAMFTVDANGGWSLDDAIAMSHWLGDHGVQYLEQPLAVGEEKHLSVLRQQSPLPIFVDESCFTSEDIPKLASLVDGVNLKIMKAGGLSEVLRMINIAKACGLQIMFGCYSDSSLANTAMSHLSPLADYLDLDSHLNLLDDPFTGALLESGRLLPNHLSGLGVRRRDRI